jgi:hypothetical protein
VVAGRWRERSSAAVAHKLGERERMVQGGPVGVALFYRCGRAVGEAVVDELWKGNCWSLIFNHYQVRGRWGD